MTLCLAMSYMSWSRSKFASHP